MTDEPINPEYKDFVRSQFSNAGFIKELGMELADFEPGWCETRLHIRPSHLQQDGFVHAGVIATMADHSGGMAAGTMAEAGKKVLTVEYKINLVRPGVGEALRCRSTVVKAGKRITVCDSEVFAEQGGVEKIIAKALVTLALV